LQEVNGDVADRPASYWRHRSEMEENAHAKCNFAGKAVKHFAMMLGPSRRSERLADKKHISIVYEFMHVAPLHDHNA